jgi:hypothetical protein
MWRQWRRRLFAVVQCEPIAGASCTMERKQMLDSNWVVLGLVICAFDFWLMSQAKQDKKQIKYFGRILCTLFPICFSISQFVTWSRPLLWLSN